MLRKCVYLNLIVRNCISRYSMEEKPKKGVLAKKLLRSRTVNVPKDVKDLPLEDESPYFAAKKSNVSSNVKNLNARKKADKKEEIVKESVKSKDLPEASHPEASGSEGPKSSKTAKWEPESWHQVLENLRSMRSKSDAPVDTMGCHKCADSEADEKTIRYHKLVALMLSSQTKDQITFEAMGRLKDRGLTPKAITEIETKELEELLKPVSFYKNKAKYLQATSKVLLEKYDGDIPNNIEELVKLHGVGPKMAHICMNTAWGVVSGIGVDVHVHRISNRLGWVKKSTKDPEKTRNELESWLPECYWSDVNHLLVGFGQTICVAKNPRCDQCLNNAICPSAKITKKEV